MRDLPLGTRRRHATAAYTTKTAATFSLQTGARATRPKRSEFVLARPTRALGDEPAHESAWTRGAHGEEQVAKILNHDVVVHDRRIPGSRANIDHIAFAPSGVWVIDSKRYSGKVAIITPLLGPTKLTIAGRDKTTLVDGAKLLYPRPLPGTDAARRITDEPLASSPHRSRSAYQRPKRASVFHAAHLGPCQITVDSYEGNVLYPRAGEDFAVILRIRWRRFLSAAWRYYRLETV